MNTHHDANAGKDLQPAVAVVEEDGNGHKHKLAQHDNALPPVELLVVAICEEGQCRLLGLLFGQPSDLDSVGELGKPAVASVLLPNRLGGRERRGGLKRKCDDGGAGVAAAGRTGGGGLYHTTKEMSGSPMQNRIMTKMATMA